MKRDYVPLFGTINTSTKLADLPDHRARLFYLLLLPQCDSWGRCTAEPRQLCARVWPMLGESPDSVRTCLAACAKAGLVHVFKEGDLTWLQVPDWEQKAGRVGHGSRRGASEWPSPPDQSGLSPDSIGLRPPESRAEQSRTEESRERKGSTRSARAFNPHAILSEFGSIDTPEVRSAVDAYLEARRSKHGSWSPQGMRIALRKLNGATPAQVVAAFEAATEGPWQTVWPVNGEGNGHVVSGRRNGQAQGANSNGGRREDGTRAGEYHEPRVFPRTA